MIDVFFGVFVLAVVAATAWGTNVISMLRHENQQREVQEIRESVVKVRDQLDAVAPADVMRELQEMRRDFNSSRFTRKDADALIEANNLKKPRGNE